jgi:hypothetical protein
MAGALKSRIKVYPTLKRNTSVGDSWVKLAKKCAVKGAWTSAGGTPARELVRSTAAPIAIGWGDPFASGLRGALLSPVYNISYGEPAVNRTDFAHLQLR